MSHQQKRPNAYQINQQSRYQNSDSVYSGGHLQPGGETMSNRNLFTNQRHSFYSKGSEIGFFGLKPKENYVNAKKSETSSSLVNQIKT